MRFLLRTAKRKREKQGQQLERAAEKKAEEGRTFNATVPLMERCIMYARERKREREMEA